MNSAFVSKFHAPACEAIEFCTVPVDIVIQASDGTLLGTHMKNLEVFNSGFPYGVPVTHEFQDTIKLAEDSETLRLLLKFSHNEDYGEVEKLGLDKIIRLMEAADKYGNCFALCACKVAMNRIAKKSSEHAVRVIPYKVRYRDYYDMDPIVESTMNVPLADVIVSMRHFPRVYLVYVSIS
ncbi:hypothetical protein VNI00_009201 [Paramarasmius palmivorus]|uniref:Uncharacterized protein n=1 Tax=Paramarasmius palmivorus TaxID=297713 RepID=A0AAW0CST1_9AGAR